MSSCAQVSSPLSWGVSVDGGKAGGSQELSWMCYLVSFRKEHFLQRLDLSTLNRFFFFFPCLPEIEELTSRLLELVLQLVILYQYFQSRNTFLQLGVGAVFYFREVSKSLNVCSTLLFGSFSSMILNLNMLGCLFLF